jgi:hypothetical protein
MNYQNLKTIPELQDKMPDERNRLVKAAYSCDRGLYGLNMLLAFGVSICVPASIYLMEWVLGYRSLLRSIPLYLLLAGITAFVMTRCFIYPRIAKALRDLAADQSSRS